VYERESAREKSDSGGRGENSEREEDNHKGRKDRQSACNGGKCEKGGKNSRSIIVRNVGKIETKKKPKGVNLKTLRRREPIGGHTSERKLNAEGMVSDSKVIKKEICRKGRTQIILGVRESSEKSSEEREQFGRT